MKKTVLCLGVPVILLLAGDLKQNSDGELIYSFGDGISCILEQATEEVCPGFFVCDDYYDANEDGILTPGECDGIKAIWSAFDDDIMYIMSFWQGQEGKELELFIWPHIGDVIHMHYDPLPTDDSYALYEDDAFEFYTHSNTYEGTWDYIWVLDQKYYARSSFTLVE